MMPSSATHLLKNVCIEKGFIKEKSYVTDMLYTCVLNAGYLIKRLKD